MTFTILAVCAANICRSPLVAVSLERSFLVQGLGGDVVVRSAGVSARPGRPVCADMARLTRSRSLPWLALGQHRSLPLTDQMIDDADLILTADRGLRSEIVKRGRPGSVARTFTLREAAELGDAASFHVEERALEEPLRSLSDQLNHSRGFIDLPGVERVAARTRPWRRLGVHTHDVPDAHDEPRAPHDLVFRLIVSTADRLAAALAHGALDHPR
jgi:protein-tyrosine phosphatase